MKNKVKSDLLRGIVGSACLVIAGLVLLLNPDFGSAAVAVIIGWVLVAAGVLGIVVSILSWPVFGLLELAVCVLALVIGVYILRNPLSLASILGIILGIYLVIQGLGALRDALRLKRLGMGFVSNLVLAVVMAGLGLVLIVSPLTTSRLIMTLVGLGMIAVGVVNLVIRARVAKTLRDNPGKQKIIDADE